MTTALPLFDEAQGAAAVGSPLDLRVVQPVPERTGMGTHQSAAMKNDEWLTPPHVLRALGPFDLDPCAPVVRPWPMAAEHFTAHDGGLTKPWRGRVWLNPPYGQETGRWMQRLAEHGNGIALIFARTETAIFFPWVWEYATAWLFLKGRLHFHYVDGTRAAANSGAPSVLVAYGDTNATALERSGLPGKLLHNASVSRRARPAASPSAARRVGQRSADVACRTKTLDAPHWLPYINATAARRSSNQQESAMNTIYSTAAEAIERSISHDEIARCKRTDANLATLREQCEGHVEADEHEFWGEDDNGNEWRVHVPSAA